ncbi:MAG: Ppx/GppA family phosphatase, partial [Nitrobacter sp.]
MNDDTRHRADPGARDGSQGLAAGMTVASAVGHSPADGAGVYAALDLGTNNCRLLIASPAEDGFRVIDSFSRIVRLGEGISS